MIQPRHLVAGVLLFFCWKGASIDMEWPRPPAQTVVTPTPSEEALKWAEPLKAILPKMLPSDRLYMSRFYDAMVFVLNQDKGRKPAIIATTDNFVVFHAGSLNMAIEKAKVGRYPGLDSAIDQVYFAAVGADPAQVDDAKREKLIEASNVLAYVFRVHGE